KKSVNKSFNMVSVDKDTSTSDMVVVMANGLAGKVNYKKFQGTLDYVCTELEKNRAKDVDGATKLFEVKSKNAITEADAEKIAKSVISSNLVKCAVFGNDPNWGRIFCAIGNSGAKFRENLVDIYIGKEIIVKNGTATGFNLDKVKSLMNSDILTITIDLHQGKGNAIAYGCDMSYDYIKINALYTT
ncbi:MAG: bifunctional ornithine acetyltransferase/N-acetylglutamate synthase, partial [Nanoarchaeota archaeon]|nr:bifunctional ornithine acetyltransferase/N-acetylglutamate synthase [Nanoarchaeota archaeon]